MLFRWEKTHNIALTRLSLRQPLNKSDNINGLARIENLSDTIHTTRFILQQDEQIIDSQNIELSASGSATATFSIAPLKHGNVQARLESVNDFLPLDDSLQLETSQLNPVLRYGITGDCSPHLMAVLESHPALIHDNSTVDLLINCNQQDDSRRAILNNPH